MGEAMDNFDKQIIEALRVNARQSVSAIAQQVNLSRPAVSERIKRLEQSGTIRGYQVVVSESSKEQVSVYFEVRHSYERCRDVADIFVKIPAVISCNGTSGDVVRIVFVRAESMQRIHEIRDMLDTNRKFLKIKTHVVMSEWIMGR